MTQENKYETVSIFMITYNHEAYIKHALESILTQKVNFDYKIVVGEDCSTDKTRDILIEYADRYPGRFKLILNEVNIGWMENFRQTLKACNGKYIAFLEGDDYWAYENKLQNQFDFLENNKAYNAYFHNAKVIDEDEPDLDKLVYSQDRKEIVTLADLGDGDYLKFCTLFCRNVNESFEPIFSGKIPAKDVSVGYCLLYDNHNAYYNSSVWAVFRRHVGGVHSKISHVERLRHSIYCLRRYIAYYQDEILSPRLRVFYKAQNKQLMKMSIKAIKPLRAMKALFRYISS